MLVGSISIGKTVKKLLQTEVDLYALRDVTGTYKIQLSLGTLVNTFVEIVWGVVL